VSSAPRPAVLVLLAEDERWALGEPWLARLRAEGYAAELHALSPAALDSDRSALAELAAPLSALERRAEVDRERLAVLGFGRGGTLAFLLGCTRRVAAVVDVDGPVLHPTLTSARPSQPLELALNFEGAFLGLFAEAGAVGAEERALLGAMLTSAARPHELVVAAGAREGFCDPRARGYDARRAEELALRVHAFLGEHLASPCDQDSPR